MVANGISVRLTKIQISINLRPSFLQNMTKLQVLYRGMELMKPNLDGPRKNILVTNLMKIVVRSASLTE